MLFYNWIIPELGSWLGLESGFAGTDLLAHGIHSVCSGDTGREVAVVADQTYWSVFHGVCMGWSWSLFFCQDAFTAAASLVNPRRDLGLAVERQPAPTVEPGKPVGLLYVS